jgi:NB-ARC domain
MVRSSWDCTRCSTRTWPAADCPAPASWRDFATSSRPRQNRTSAGIGRPDAGRCCFQVRDIAARLDTALAGGGTAIVRQIVSGLGGVGKTQLAAALARRLWDGANIDVLVWITANSVDAVVSGYAEAAATVTGYAGDDPVAVARRFLAWLADTDQRWLVALDDLTQPNDLDGWWPLRTATGRTVVTTRRRGAALATRGQLVPVDLLTDEEALAYLAAKFAGQPGRLMGASELASDLGHLPVALAQAAAYIADRRGAARRASRAICGDLAAIHRGRRPARPPGLPGHCWLR